jgi:hypothetical protein
LSQPSPELWKIDFYVDEDGSFPVRVWLDCVPEEVRGKVMARINLFKTGGATLDSPYTSQIEGKLREALDCGWARPVIASCISATKLVLLSYYMASPKPPPQSKKPT